MDYHRIYKQLINKAAERTISGYKEKHHIIPKCMGGTNDKDNIVEKSKENNQLFSDFIQRLKFGESTFLQPANDTIIQNTNVEKLRNILLIS